MKVTCSFCERTLQDGEDNRDIDNYSLCSKCYKKFGAIVKHFSKKSKIETKPKSSVKKKITSKSE
jgi:hypothetical protein